MERPILAGRVPGPRLATLGLAGVIGLVGVAGPWAAVSRSSESGRAAFASKLDSLAKTQEKHSAALTHPRAAASAPAAAATTPAPVPVAPPVPLPSDLAPNLPAPVPAEPLRVLLVGDSTAFSAALGLYPQQEAWKVTYGREPGRLRHRAGCRCG